MYGLPYSLLRHRTCAVHLLARHRQMLVRLHRFHLRHVQHLRLVSSYAPNTMTHCVGTQEKTVFKLVLTGGPCGGKTTGQSRLCTFFENLGWKVYRVPETANMLLSGGIKFSDLSDEEAFHFQENLLKTMIQMENTFFSLAESCGKNCLVICDRGTMDAAAFISPEKWERMLVGNGWNPIELRDNRYNMIIHMVSAANGAEAFYTTMDHSSRSETLEEARLRDLKAAESRSTWLGRRPFGVRPRRFSSSVGLALPLTGLCVITSRCKISAGWPWLPTGGRVKVELFANERSTRDQLYLFFFKNKTTNVVVHFSLLCFKLVTCALYVIRVILDDASEADCYGCVAFPCRHLKEYEWPKNCSEMEGNSELLCWSALLWVQNPTSIWGLQVAIAIWTLSLTIFLGGLKYKGEFWRIVDLYFFVEVITTVPFIVTLFHSPLRNVFIPVFLNCWLAKRTLEHMFIHHKYFQTTNLLSHQVLAVASTMICLAFTSICGFQHIQRVGCRRYNLFESSYFVAITLTTVGYGDLFPDVWLSKFFMVTMILLALALMPKKFESLAFSWMERQKVGGSYNKSSRRPDRHVVVCSTQVTADTLTDFLTEFFSYRQLMDVSVVVLSPSDLDIEMRQVLAVPIWAQKVYYIKGSCLKDSDLRRVRMKDSDACFILGIDSTVNKTVADEHTILRSWAVKDFAPNVPQYVQIFRPENKVHIKFAEFVVCEDEVKYAMLAYNCICPGASTMLTLLLHTSRGEEGQTCKDEWIRLYGRGSGNEVYHVILKDSLIFSEYAGRSFTYTSLHTHRRYGVVLIGTKSTHDAKESYIKLNPGPSHVMRETDICFYLSISREENMNFSVDDKSEASPFTSKLHKVGDMIFRRNLKSIRPVPRGPGRNGGHLPDYNEHNASPTREKSYDEDPLWLQDSEECEIVMDYPRVTPYIGASPTLCHIRSEKKKVCCMELTRDCEHCRYRNVQEYHWPNPTIILVAEQGNSGVYNFIVPLRAHYLSKGSLQPIILLLEKRPDPSFLDVIAWFPLVYFMQGCIKNLDDLLRAGIIIADNVVVVNKDGDASVKEEDLADSNTIVAVQSVLELFPTVKITTELSQSSNMRFMHFQASNAYALYLSDIEKREMERGSNISFMFRLQFASGSVFSANMMDTLLYQAFVKDYIIIIMRLILGIDQAPGSGYLTSMKVTSKELKLGTYGSLFAELCATGGDVPICIYRTQVDIGASAHDSEETDVSSLESWESFTKDVENTEINNLVTSRMLNLGIKTSGYEHTTEQQTSVSYVIINPSCDLNLEEGDIIFVLRPNRLKSYPIYRRASTTSRSTQTLNKPSGPPASDGSYSSLQSHPSTFNSANDVTAPGHTPRTRLVAPDSIEQFQYDRQHHL